MTHEVCGKCKQPMVMVEYCPNCNKGLRIEGINPDPHGEHRLFWRLAKEAAEMGGLELIWLKAIDYHGFAVISVVRPDPGNTDEINIEDRIRLAEDNHFTRSMPWLTLRFEPEVSR